MNCYEKYGNCPYCIKRQDMQVRSMPERYQGNPEMNQGMLPQGYGRQPVMDRRTQEEYWEDGYQRQPSINRVLPRDYQVQPNRNQPNMEQPMPGMYGRETEEYQMPLQMPEGMPENYERMPMQNQYGMNSGMDDGMQNGFPTNMGNDNQLPQGMNRPVWEDTPFNHMKGYPKTLKEEQENEKDLDRIKSMYPDVAKQIAQHVDEECDKMEYDGSFMFDEQPDRVMLMKLTNDIYDKVKDDYEMNEEEDRDELFAMNKETRRRYPPRKNWLGDMISVMLLNEMHRRRCRHRNCRKGY